MLRGCCWVEGLLRGPCRLKGCIRDIDMAAVMGAARSRGTVRHRTIPVLFSKPSSLAHFSLSSS